ncbi:nickel-responsive transcriptional regulator NikR [Halochromatium glycolicum]|jgi:CopG family nickel-responsive transcriptional regulator|uniref:Putative nickel-responsive regulator n=1 Tax=Halochromatium glycolicum TaxID=85075 RepID=A0AAJ0U5M4_9GAMM|nr:nickel-responsive transcriptional regulator NikR [Halochromatium glycolicum]MBK1705706.1 nickel-responsive transcriptional regulator NikR [Halochromatium glycolicum]
MQRITITLDDPLTEAFEGYMVKRGYTNRSEAIRDLIRERLHHEQLTTQPEGQCVATLSYVYNHHERELATRLTTAHHEHHDLTVSTMHVHLSHDHCLETVILRGPAQRVQVFADAVIAQPGVLHGNLSVLPVSATEQAHQHGSEPHDHEHSDSEQDAAQQAIRHLHLEPIA